MWTSPEAIKTGNRAVKGAKVFWFQWMGAAVALWLVIAVAMGVWASRRWPLVNDAALIHYISFMMDGGRAPYRQLIEMDLPGTFLLDWSVVHLLGPGPVAWRVFDAFVMLCASAAMVAIARPERWIAGVLGSGTFWLLHLRDGIGQAGQRDLVEAALLLGMVAFVFHGIRRGRAWPLLPAGLCAGAAATIKPDALVCAVLVFALLPQRGRWGGRSPGAPALAAATGLLLPFAAVGFSLWREHAVAAFWHTATEIIPYYASLGRLPLPALLRNWMPAPLRLLAVVTIALAVAARRRWRWEQTVLAAGVLWGLGSFLLQGKGFPYQRYPTMAFLVLLASLVCAEALGAPGWRRVLAAATVGFMAFVLAPLSLARTVHAEWNSALLVSLQSDLGQLGGAGLDGSIQCIDSIVGCNTVLLRLGLHQQTGLVTDFLVFGPDTVPAVQRTRAVFWKEMGTRLPRVLVVTGALHPRASDEVAFDKLAMWPAFAHLLASRYDLVTERSFAPGASGPLAYRIYRLRPAGAGGYPGR